MIERPLDLYYCARPLFAQDVPNSPMLCAVLEGRYPRHVFVDDTADPTRGVVIATIGFTFISGAFSQPGRSVMVHWDEDCRVDVCSEARRHRAMPRVWLTTTVTAARARSARMCPVTLRALGHLLSTTMGKRGSA